MAGSSVLVLYWSDHSPQSFVVKYAQVHAEPLQPPDKSYCLTVFKTTPVWLDVNPQESEAARSLHSCCLNVDVLCPFLQPLRSAPWSWRWAGSCSYNCSGGRISIVCDAAKDGDVISDILYLWHILRVIISQALWVATFFKGFPRYCMYFSSSRNSGLVLFWEWAEEFSSSGGEAGTSPTLQPSPL